MRAGQGPGPWDSPGLKCDSCGDEPGGEIDGFEGTFCGRDMSEELRFPNDGVAICAGTYRAIASPCLQGSRPEDSGVPSVSATFNPQTRDVRIRPIPVLHALLKFRVEPAAGVSPHRFEIVVIETGRCVAAAATAEEASAIFRRDSGPLPVKRRWTKPSEKPMVSTSTGGTP